MRGSIEEHERDIREMLSSGETPEFERRGSERIHRVRAIVTAELQRLNPRIAWWLFVVLVAALWFFEATSFAQWWGTAGMLIGLLFGLVLLPLFPIVAFVEGFPGRAIVAAALLIIGAWLLERSWPEASRFAETLRRLWR